ncbi:NUDIX hydrolase [Candidatus Nomurabacteria bacterium]|nr:NUDIX hydrolase [Candidatus Nomurabacteria bacterium]
MQEFGIKRENEERRDGGCGVIFDPETQKYAVGEKINNGVFVLFGGGVNPDEDIKDGVTREVMEESGLYDFIHIEKIEEVLCHYHNNSKNVDRVAHATCFLFILKNKNLIPTQLEEHENFTLVWSIPKEMKANWEARNQNKDYDHWFYFLDKAVIRAKELGYDKTSVL